MDVRNKFDDNMSIWFQYLINRYPLNLLININKCTQSGATHILLPNM